LVTVDSKVLLANAVTPMTVLLIIAEVKDRLPLKDAVPMLVTVLGVVTVVIPEFRNACVPILVTPLFNVKEVKVDKF